MWLNTYKQSFTLLLDINLVISLQIIVVYNIVFCSTINEKSPRLKNVYICFKTIENDVWLFHINLA